MVENNLTSSAFENEKTKIIATLNDQFRKTFSGGEIFMTQGVCGLPLETQEKVMQAVRKFDGFTEDNDPYGEHDFGTITVNGEVLFWKIDYLDLSMEYGSENPSNVDITKRILTIMLTEEY